MSESPYMRIKETAEYVGVAECTIRRWIADYGFPKPLENVKGVNINDLI